MSMLQMSSVRFPHFALIVFCLTISVLDHHHLSPRPPRQRVREELGRFARSPGRTGPCCSFCVVNGCLSLKNSDFEPQFLKYKGRVVFRGDIVKDDSVKNAVFTEQGSSASQMTAAKVMDIISRLPGCSGQAAYAVSACTQVKMEDSPTLFEVPKSVCPDIWIRLPKHRGPKSWEKIEDLVVPIPPQTQVMSPTSPTSPITRIRSTIRSTSPTTTQIPGAQTTAP